MFDLTENYNISRRLAAQGMILLKNEDRTLPLRRSDKIGIVGRACLDLIKGGGGSSLVKCEYEKSLLKGLEEKAKSGKIDFFDGSVKLAGDTDGYDISMLNELAKSIDKVVVVLKRYGTEGDDRQLGQNVMYNGETTGATDTTSAEYEKSVGYFYPAQYELELFDK